MNRQKINQLAQTSNIEYQKIDDHKRNFRFFNGYTSDLHEFDVFVNKKNSHYECHIVNALNYNAGQMHLDTRPIIRSYQLASLKLIGFVACKSEKAAKKYSNLGGHVVCVKNGYSKLWGVIK